MNQTLKRYIASSVVTFLTGFLGAVLMSLQTLTLSELLEAGALIGILSVALRAGIKALVEFLPVLLKK